MMQTLDQLRAGELKGIRQLKLSCGLTQFPAEIFSLADTLEVLDLSGNQLSHLPDNFSKLAKLRILFCSENLFDELPAVLGACPELSMVGFKSNQISRVSAKALPINLRWLILTNNQIESLPDEIGNCVQLQKLMLAGNRLQKLPVSLINCQRLELLRISANQLNQFPQQLLTLPRLSWLAFSGNPFCTKAETQVLEKLAISQICWADLKLGQLLGEGASGQIYQANYSNDQVKLDSVAVKLFKGLVTSDGLPGSEMLAAIAAGQHPNLISIHGQLIDHPLAVDGLVMALIDTEFTNLAGPPSLDSCTRDIYPQDSCFDWPQVLAIAIGIAAAMRHLHAKGLLHGDLYAHNILHCGKGRALIGDFGAASFCPDDLAISNETLQRFEVRAFGCLLEELLERCVESETSLHLIQALHRLKAECLSEDLLARPLFTEIAARLGQLC